MSILQDISKRLLDVSNVPPEKRNDALMQVLIYIETVQYDMVLEQKNLIMSVIEDLIAENDAEQIAKSKLVFVPDVEEQIAPTKKTRAKKVVKPVAEEIGEDLPDFIGQFPILSNLPLPVRKLADLRRKEQGKTRIVDMSNTLASLFDWDKTPEDEDFWRKINIEGDLTQFKKKFGNKGEKVDDLIEFAEINEFVEGLSQPVASEDLPDTVPSNSLIKDLPLQVQKLVILRNIEQADNTDLTGNLSNQLDWSKTSENSNFWQEIHNEGDLTRFKKRYGNKGEKVDEKIEKMGFTNFVEQTLNPSNSAPASALAPAVKTRKPRTPKVAPVVAPVVTTQKLLFLRLIFNPPVGSAIKLEVYNPEELHYAIIGILNKLDVVSLFFNFEAVTDFSSYLTKEKIYYHNEPIEIVEKLIETFDKFVTPELDWSDFVDNATDVLRINDNKKELDDAFEKHKKPAPIIIPKPVKVVTPKVVAPKVVTPKPVKVVAPKVVKTKVTKPKVEDDLSFLDDLNNIF
jgi:hypothetical protein